MTRMMLQSSLVLGRRLSTWRPASTDRDDHPTEPTQGKSNDRRDRDPVPAPDRLGERRHGRDHGRGPAGGILVPCRAVESPEAAGCRRYRPALAPSRPEYV